MHAAQGQVPGQAGAGGAAADDQDGGIDVIRFLWTAATWITVIMRSPGVLENLSGTVALSV